MNTDPNRWGIIYNPKAGTRKVQKRWKEIKEYIESKQVAFDYVQSEGFGTVEVLHVLTRAKDIVLLLSLGEMELLMMQLMEFLLLLPNKSVILLLALFQMVLEMTLLVTGILIWIIKKLLTGLLIIAERR